MATPYSAIAVANWFINRKKTDQCDITHLKIQKLLYYAQGWHLAYFDTVLFEDAIFAWKYGPVIHSIYNALKIVDKEQQIIELIYGYLIDNGKYIPAISYIDQDDKETLIFLDEFWSSYSKYNPWMLVNSTHQAGTPWTQVIEAYNSGKSFNDIIPIELLKFYFKSIIPEISNR
jgi:uncharacterized phage-associated protein